MAAKPPKPPGKFLKSVLNQNNKQQNNEEQETQQCNSEICHTSTTDNCNTIPLTATTITTTASTTTTTASTAKKPDCNCSNISIMHLFHEMKQEFPTIPDTVVAQCVNENCHQRDNCIQMLRNELALNPIPVQSYPAKILHPPTTTTNNNRAAATPTSSQKPPLQQKPQLVQQKPPLKPLRPIRAAPLQPTTPTPTQNLPQLPSNTTSALTTTTNRNKLQSGCVGINVSNGSVCDSSSSSVGEFNEMPSITSPQQKQTQPPPPLTVNSNNEVNNNENAMVRSGGESIERNIPKQRPTTLNLNAHQQNQQQQQRQRLNIQLQKHFQEQRNKQHQQPQTTRPTRKAPLPPIAPKPSQYQFNATANSNNNNHFNDTLSSTHTSPLSESEISVSVSLSTPSPTSSLHNTTQHSTPIQQYQQLPTKSPIRHRSVITLQPEPPYTRDFATATSNALITSTSANTSPTTSLAGSQKSFTSVNLTLRPPVTPTGSGTPGSGTALQPSTIDITAGPGFSGASGGGKSLHYSSTSYDARLGYQQNFQITVTDEGGVFSASRIRPQQQQRCLNQVNICENQYDGNSGVENNSNNENYVNSLYAEQQQNLQQQQQLYLLHHQQFHNNNVVALQQNIQNSINSPQGIGGGFEEKMCVPPQQALDGFTAEILQRQKKRRDKLAAALRENKKRLGQVDQEINLITGPIPSGLSERLDIEIQKLRTDCQAMLRSSNPFTQQTQQQQQQLQQQQQQQLEISQIQQQQPQPFPRQRPARPPPRPPPPRQTSLDFIQHHSQTSTPHTPPAASLPNLNMYNTPSPILAQQPHLQHSNSLSPSFSNHYHQQQHQPANITTEEIYSDNDEEEYTDDGQDDDYEVVEPWECNMCTFRNHPQLNICEACDNVRILPGTLPNLSRAISKSSANSVQLTAAADASSPTVELLSIPSTTSNGAAIDNNAASIVANGLNTTANGNLEHDTNLAQQQLQHFALHT